MPTLLVFRPLVRCFWCCNLPSGLSQLQRLMFQSYLISVSASCYVMTNFVDIFLLSACSGHDATSLRTSLHSHLQSTNFFL
ncbi:hypothetical protein PAMP_020818 [Pampus punctatissimus]